MEHEINGLKILGIFEIMNMHVEPWHAFEWHVYIHEAMEGHEHSTYILQVCCGTQKCGQIVITM